MNNLLLDNSLLQDLNDKERAFLDANDYEIRKGILWYIEKIEHYRHMLSSPGPCFDFSLTTEEIHESSAKFMYTFWFEAMVWYIRIELSKKEAADKAKQNPKKDDGVEP